LLVKRQLVILNRPRERAPSLRESDRLVAGLCTLLTSLITQATPREEQGVVLRLTQSLNSVSMIVAPPLGGLLIDHGWLTAWGLAASGVPFIGLILASGSPDELRENRPAVNATTLFFDSALAEACAIFPTA
jgi:MFS family permease